MRPWLVSWLVLSVACSEDAMRPAGDHAQGSAGAAPAPVLEPGAFPPEPVAGPVSAWAPLAPPPALSPVRVRLSRIVVTEAEDGHGRRVRAPRAVAIDLESDHGWHAGALATSLSVGGLRFFEAGYPTITTMRFVAADEAALPRDAEVALEVAGAPSRRRVVAASLPEAR